MRRLAIASVLLAACNPEFNVNDRDDTAETGAPDTDDGSDTSDSSVDTSDSSVDTSDSSVDTSDSSVDTSDSSDTSDTSEPDPVGCHATPAPADRTRYVVAAKPFGPSGQGANKWEIFALSSAGAISRPGTVFEMGRAFLGQVAFTPDGALAATAHDDGTVGLVRISATGQPTVVHARYDGGDAFYAESVTFSADGAHLWVVDVNWPNNGGGLYKLDVACDGTLSNPRKVVESKLARNFFLNAAGTRALVPAVEIAGRAADAFLFDPSTGAAIAAGAIWPDDDAIVSHGAWTGDGSYALIADNSAFSGVPNRVGVFSVGATTLTPLGVISGFEDPIQIVPSPYDDGALVVTGMGDAVHLLKRDGGGGNPWRDAGQPSYSGGRPQLPSGAAVVTRGPQKGLVLVGELEGIRRMKFNGAGGIADQGLFTTGTTIQESLGAIGVQP